jgi:hypothetical protein
MLPFFAERSPAGTDHLSADAASVRGAIVRGARAYRAS